jgi:hypothetical protein
LDRASVLRENLVDLGSNGMLVRGSVKLDLDKPVLLGLDIGRQTFGSSPWSGVPSAALAWPSNSAA